MFERKTPLIIVCTEGTQKYGSYLMQLVGLKDDDENQIVGIADGSVEATLWTEKEYEANRPTIGSSAKILFIGVSKEMKAEKANMNSIFNEYGMHFDSLGNHAVAYIDEKAMSKKDYNEFLNFTQGYQKTYEQIDKKVSSGTKKGIAFSLLIFGGLYGVAGTLIWNWAKKRREINNQRYAFLTLYTYLECLSDFIEG